MGVKWKPDIVDIIQKKRLQWYGHVKKMLEERIPKLIMEWIRRDRRKRGRPRKNMDGRSANSHDNKEFRTRSMEKQRGIAFGVRKTATAVKKNQIDR
jgi:IS5 family transposase